jgi:hypothetical protein
MGKDDAIALALKLRSGGERGNAIKVALDAGLTPDEVPFIDGYDAIYVVPEKPAAVAKQPK